MSTPASPSPISMNDINVELGVAGTTTRTMNDAQVRALLGVLTDASSIDMDTARGKSKNIIATGGTIYTTGGYKYHVFLSTGYFDISAVPVIAGIDILAVAGGGGGSGKRGSGGGGGGASVTTVNTAYSNATLTALQTGRHTVYVGAGGSGTTDVFARGGIGNPTNVVNTLSVTIASNGGGGGGGGYYAGDTAYGNGSSPNGSGAGGRWLEQGGNYTTPAGVGTGTGGNGGSYNGFGGAGGGGSGYHNGSNGPSGAGGAGNSSFASWGTAVGLTTAPGAGGDGGAGYGGVPSVAGATNTGNGGTGAGDNAGWYGAGGGSGFVVIRYPYS